MLKLQAMIVATLALIGSVPAAAEMTYIKAGMLFDSTA